MRRLSAESLHRPVLLRLHAAGEYGELLVSGSKLLENEEALTVSEGEVVSLLESVLERTGISPQCKNYALTALMKLSVRFSGQAERIKVSFQPLQPAEVRACDRIEISLQCRGRCIDGIHDAALCAKAAGHSLSWFSSG